MIDFIDMSAHKHQREVEGRLREVVKLDRARIQIGRISRFGLLEMSRQRLRPSLEESTQSVCGRCNGIGHVRSVESLALATLRLVGEEARKERTSRVVAQLPVEVSNYVLNEKRDWINRIQQSNNVDIVLVGDRSLETPNYTITRLRDDEAGQPEHAVSSYKLVESKQDPSDTYRRPPRHPKPEKAAVAGVVHRKPAPKPAKRKASFEPRPAGLWRRLFGWMLPEPGKQRRSGSKRSRSAVPAAASGRTPAPAAEAIARAGEGPGGGASTAAGRKPGAAAIRKNAAAGDPAGRRSSAAERAHKKRPASSAGRSARTSRSRRRNCHLPDPGSPRRHRRPPVGTDSRHSKVISRPDLPYGGQVAGQRQVNRAIAMELPQRANKRAAAGACPSRPGYCDSQTMNRSFISSALSLHQFQSFRKARSVCSGVLGMCGRISTPVSRCVDTSASADLRTGL